MGKELAESSSRLSVAIRSPDQATSDPSPGACGHRWVRLRPLTLQRTIVRSGLRCVAAGWLANRDGDRGALGNRLSERGSAIPGGSRRCFRAGV
jgi:hypothetical protein